MIGLTGCSASAEVNPTPTPTTATATPTGAATATPSPTTTRRRIAVQLNPNRVNAGELTTVWVLANCPRPTGGPSHTGTATSRAFIAGIPLESVTAGSTPAPTGAPAGQPWVRGSGQVSGTVRRGTYTVTVECDGTNDTGTARLRVVPVDAPEDDGGDDQGDGLPDNVPTRAPRAGGGGTYAQDAGDEPAIPLGPAGLLIGLAVAAGIGYAVKRRNRA